MSFHALEHSQCFLGRFANYPAVRALTKVPLQFGTYMWIESLVEVVVQVLQKLFTGNQERLPPFA